jgi:hypothetical protein
MHELLMEMRAGFKETKDIHEKVTIMKQGWDSTQVKGPHTRSWAQMAAANPGTSSFPLDRSRTRHHYTKIEK